MMKFDLTNVLYHLESRAIEISLTLIVFLGSAYYGVTDILKEMLSGLNIPGFAIAFGLLVFCYTGVITGKLILQCVIKSAKAFFSTFFNVLATTLKFTVNYLEERHRTKIKIIGAIKRLNEHELAFLELFHPNGIALKRIEDELLPHNIYESNYTLRRIGILSVDSQKGDAIEKYFLPRNAVKLLRKYVFKGRRPLREVSVALSRVASSQRRGSGL